MENLHQGGPTSNLSEGPGIHTHVAYLTQLNVGGTAFPSAYRFKLNHRYRDPQGNWSTPTEVTSLQATIPSSTALENYQMQFHPAVVVSHQIPTIYFANQAATLGKLGWQVATLYQPGALLSPHLMSVAFDGNGLAFPGFLRADLASVGHYAFLQSGVETPLPGSTSYPPVENLSLASGDGIYAVSILGSMDGLGNPQQSLQFTKNGLLVNKVLISSGTDLFATDHPVELALDRQNQPSLVYAYGQDAFYAKRVNGIWMPGKFSNLAAGCRSTSIVVDKTGVVHTAMVCGTSAYYLESSDTGWNLIDPRIDHVFRVRVTVDESSGQTHLLVANNEGLFYLTLVGSSWQVETLDRTGNIIDCDFAIEEQRGRNNF